MGTTISKLEKSINVMKEDIKVYKRKQTYLAQELLNIKGLFDNFEETIIKYYGQEVLDIVKKHAR